MGDGRGKIARIPGLLELTCSPGIFGEMTILVLRGRADTPCFIQTEISYVKTVSHHSH